MNRCLTCRNSLKGLQTEQSRNTLCKYCKRGSNYEDFRSDDLTRVQRFNEKLNSPKKRKVELSTRLV